MQEFMFNWNKNKKITVVNNLRSTEIIHDKKEHKIQDLQARAMVHLFAIFFLYLHGFMLLERQRSSR